jgi:hypothetical protein
MRAAALRLRRDMAMRLILAGGVAAVLVLACRGGGAAQPLHRDTVWDLKLGEPVSAQPSPEQFRGFACGANGGPPRLPLGGWKDFARCRPEPGGSHEVYFEYDDELEYIARAHDLEGEITRWAGTTEARFPVIVSALFDDAGVLEGIRIITDPRPEHRDHITEANLRTRAEAYIFGSVMAARFNIEPARNCKSLPPAAGESAVGNLFIKQSCEMIDTRNHRRILLQSNLFRKPGQSGVNPQLPSQLTQGQFESSARVEIRSLSVP